MIDHYSFKIRESKPSISVVCAWFNRAEYLDDTLQSLFNQDFSSFEIILVNDGSTDPSLKQKLDTYNDCRLRIIHQENKGFVGAIRCAIDNARGEYIAIQGAGDISFPNRLSQQYFLLTQRPDIVAVGCMREKTLVGGLADGKRISPPFQQKQVWTKTDLTSVQIPFGHGEIMFRKVVYDRVGGYRDYFKYAQDRDLWPRMAEYGDFFIIHQVLYSSRIFLIDGVSANPQKMILQQQLLFFAVQCVEDRDLYGFDFVDLYGNHAGLFNKSSKNLISYLSKAALKHLIYGNNRSAILLADLSIRQRLSIQGIVSLCLVRIALFSPLLKKLITMLLSMKKISDSHMTEPLVPEENI